MMFTTFRKKSLGIANDHGYNDAWLGLPNTNPYPAYQPEYAEYNRGYQDGEDLVEEYTNSSYLTINTLFPFCGDF